MSVFPAPLRDDLERIEIEDGSVDIRDPRQLAVFSLDASYLGIAEHFDGQRDVKAVARLYFGNARRESVQEVEASLEQLRTLRLLEADELIVPSFENMSPHAEFEAVRKRLTKKPQVPKDAKWSCHACGDCCHGLVVEISKEEESRIDSSLYQDILDGRDFAVDSFIDPEAGPARVLRQKEGEACIFLDEAGLCLVHARQGPKAKPDACQAYPYLTIHTPQGPRLGMRTSCSSMSKSWQDGDEPDKAIPMMKALSKSHDALKVGKAIRWFGEEVPSEQVLGILEDLATEFEGGLTQARLRSVDRRFLRSRGQRKKAAFVDRVLQYAKEEQEAELPVEVGGLLKHWGRFGLGRVRSGFRRLGGDEAVQATASQSSFLGRQLRLTVQSLGPLHFPDAGLGTVSLLLSLEACLLSLRPKDGTNGAQKAYIAFTAPILENTSHAWPMLEALDLRGARALQTTYRRLYEGCE